MTVALCADLGTCGALDTPAAFAECVRMLTSTSVELKKSAEGGFGEQLQHAIAKDHAVPKLLVYFKRVERAIAEANTGKIVLSKKCFVGVMCMSSLLLELHCSRLTLGMMLLTAYTLTRRPPMRSCYSCKALRFE